MAGLLVVAVILLWPSRDTPQGPAAVAASPTSSVEPSPSRFDVEAQLEERARTFARYLVNFDHSGLEPYLTRLRRLGTDRFDTQFHEALGGDLRTFEETIRDSEAVSNGDVKSVDVDLVDPGQAVAIVIVSQTVRTRANPAPRTQLRPLELHMVATANGWEVDRVANVSE